MTWNPDPRVLSGRVALVTGATRGAGRGIAAALGEAGATVVCTGRTSRTGTTHSDYGRTETIEETAELVDSLGGAGVPVPCDHLDPAQVAALADRVRAEHGHLDVLVDDIWGGEGLHGPDNWNTPVWDLDLTDGLRMVRLGLETHLITAHHLLPLLLDRPGGGLLVEVTDGTADYNATRYRVSVVLRPRQGRAEPARVLARPRAGAARRDRGGAHPRLVALGDDARGVRDERGGLAVGHGATRVRASPRRRGMSAAPWPRSPPTRTGRGGTSARSAPPTWPGRTGSPTSTGPARRLALRAGRRDRPGRLPLTGYR